MIRLLRSGLRPYWKQITVVMVLLLVQAIANLYEVQVRKSNYSAERHHIRSQRFFYGMLAAQLGVIIATFAIAARKRNLLWALAAAAGSAAVAFAIYVYVCV